MSDLTVLGLGPMGTAVATALVSSGHDITVWNRTRARTEPLMALGATAATELGDAIASADVVLVCLRDDEAVGEVLDGADLTGRSVVNLTSSSPAGARARAEWVGRRGGVALTGAIMTPTPLMGTDRALVLLSGDERLYQTYSSTLEAFGGQNVYLGEDPGRASAFDAALLDLFWTATAGMTHALALAASEGVEWPDLEPFTPAIFGMLPEMMGRFGTQLSDGEFPGEVSTIASADAGLAHLIESTEGNRIDAGVLRAARATVQRAISQGHQEDGLGRLADILAQPA